MNTDKFFLKDSKSVVFASNQQSKHIQDLSGAPEIVSSNFIVSRVRLESLKHGPEIVEGHYYFNDTYVSSFEGIASSLGGFDMTNTLITSLVGISDHIKVFSSTFLPTFNVKINHTKITSGGIGLLLIENIEKTNFDYGAGNNRDFNLALDIILKYRSAPKESRIFDCQNELFDRGLEQFGEV